MVAAVWLLPACLPVHQAGPGAMITAMEIQSGQSPGSLTILSAATLHHQPSLTHTAHATHTHTHTDNEPFDTDRRYVLHTCCSFIAAPPNSFRYEAYREQLNMDFDLPGEVIERREKVNTTLGWCQNIPVIVVNKLNGDQRHKLE